MKAVKWGPVLRLLIESGMTQKAIAERVGCGQASVSRWARDLGVPERKYHAALIRLFEDNASLLNRALMLEIAQTENLKVMLDSRSNVISMSPAMRAVMLDLGITNWQTEITEDGLFRVITIERKK